MIVFVKGSICPGGEIDVILSVGVGEVGFWTWNTLRWCNTSCLLHMDGLSDSAGRRGIGCLVGLLEEMVFLVKREACSVSCSRFTCLPT